MYVLAEKKEEDINTQNICSDCVVWYDTARLKEKQITTIENQLYWKQIRWQEASVDKISRHTSSIQMSVKYILRFPMGITYVRKYSTAFVWMYFDRHSHIQTKHVSGTSQNKFCSLSQVALTRVAMFPRKSNSV